VWVCGCVGVWVCGCVGVWMCGRVGVWACGRVGVWVGKVWWWDRGRMKYLAVKLTPVRANAFINMVETSGSAEKITLIALSVEVAEASWFQLVIVPVKIPTISSCERLKFEIPKF
jgi:hypothetical protein